MRDPDTVGTDIGRLLALAHKRATNAFAHALRDLDLDGRLFGVLSTLARIGPATQARLIVELHSDKSVMLRAVDDLERLGLVTREPVPHDRRARVVVLTEAGHRRLDAATGIARQVSAELFGWMSDAEQNVLRDLLERFVGKDLAGRPSGD
ncbi:MarR family winged helix-turn-helix transcriptional regulator [Actinoplanes regularis]|uniref:MarR family winged helix-turn-helix transcriptional regulator n=1 Tax=Actinoplanes regularis TaxID=52697 RepID=UPI0024A2D08B|nr:MarR family transcriptional regulator [Actinoplanes regularis]GLW35955.1 MarR family transcriptional regulator [Actinoplanes regularis]